MIDRLARGGPASAQRVLLEMQRQYGNRHVQRLIDDVGAQPLVRAPMPAFPAAGLIVGSPGDRDEREADRIAEQVMRARDPSPAALAAGGSPAGVAGAPAPQIVHDALRSPSESLDPGTRSFMEPRFGYDFGGVRVHVGELASASARAVNATAYTVRQDIVFGAGAYAPATAAGRGLLAHELAHVVQQSAGLQRKPGFEQDAVRASPSGPVVRGFFREAWEAAVGPPYQPNPSWSSVGVNNPAPTCTPFDRAEANAKWQMMTPVVPVAMGARTGCYQVANAYGMYLAAHGGTIVGGPGTCISEQLASEDRSHTVVEREVETAARARVTAIAPSLAVGAPAVREPIVPNVVPGTEPSRRRVRITYRVNVKAGGALFGGDSDDGVTPDSEYGPDLRHQSGFLTVQRTDNGSDPANVTVSAALQMHYDVRDALDFCPGNTLQKPDTIGNFDYNFVITTLSRLEASGMARDIQLLASYDRSLDLGSITVPHPRP